MNEEVEVVVHLQDFFVRGVCSVTHLWISHPLLAVCQVEIPRELFLKAHLVLQVFNLHPHLNISALLCDLYQAKIEVHEYLTCVPEPGCDHVQDPIGYLEE